MPNALSATAAAWLGKSAKPSICSTVPGTIQRQRRIEGGDCLPDRADDLLGGQRRLHEDRRRRVVSLQDRLEDDWLCRFGERLILAVFDHADDFGRLLHSASST